VVSTSDEQKNIYKSFLVYNCGHVFHKKCLVEERSKETEFGMKKSTSSLEGAEAVVLM
jgi:hypothetical protein